MTRTTHSEPDTLDSIDEQAALWFTRKHSQQMSAEQAKQFDIWLHASPEHAKAYEAIAGVWREFDSMPRPASIELPRKTALFPVMAPIGKYLSSAIYCRYFILTL